jgi:hypothetical protein
MSNLVSGDRRESLRRVEVLDVDDGIQRRCMRSIEGKKEREEVRDSSVDKREI